MAQTLEEYLAWAGFRQEELRATKPTDSTSRRRLKHLVPAQGRGIARKLATDAVRIQQAKKAARLTGPRLLHLGSGGEHKDGWTNIDLLGDPVEIAWEPDPPLAVPERVGGGSLPRASPGAPSAPAWGHVHAGVLPGAQTGRCAARRRPERREAAPVIRRGPVLPGGDPPRPANGDAGVTGRCSTPKPWHWPSPRPA